MCDVCCVSCVVCCVSCVVCCVLCVVCRVMCVVCRVSCVVCRGLPNPIRHSYINSSLISGVPRKGDSTVSFIRTLINVVVCVVCVVCAPTYSHGARVYGSRVFSLLQMEWFKIRYLGWDPGLRRLSCSLFVLSLILFQEYSMECTTSTTLSVDSRCWLSSAGSVSASEGASSTSSRLPRSFRGASLSPQIPSDVGHDVGVDVLLVFPRVFHGRMCHQ